MKYLSLTAIALLTTSLSAYAQGGSPYQLGTIELESESDETLQQNGYVAQSGRQATKLESRIANIPQSIGTVTQDEIEDRKPRQLLEALEFSAGTTTSTFGFDSRYDAFYLRGFPAFNNGFFRDGLRQVNGPSAWYVNDPYTLEGIAILKGPSSSLYGVSGPGGLVNVVSKRPKAEPFNELRFTTGTDNRAELAFDFTGPVDEDGRLLYRLTGLVRDADTPLPGYKDDKILIAPSLTYDLTERTRITLLTEYSDSTVGATAAYFNPAPGVASETYNGDPAYNTFDNEQYRIGYEIAHELTDTVTLRQKMRYSEVDSELRYSGLYDFGGGAIGRGWGKYLENQSNFSVDNTIEAELETGALTHQFVAGLDYTRSEFDAFSTFGFASAAAVEATPAPYSQGQDIEQTGIYVHDQITNGALNVFVSGRYDFVETTSFDATRAGTRTTDDALTGRIGISYAMANGMTPFANFSSTFVPNTGVTYSDPTDPASDAPAAPTEAVQTELGFKYELPGTDSLVTASIFDIQQEDGVVFQPVNSAVFGGLNQVQVPYDLRSQGLELEGKFNLGNGLRMTGSYTYLDVEIEAGTTGTVGNQLSGTPKHQAALWAFYEPQNGMMEGFGIGGGLRYVGESYGDDQNTYKNRDRVFVDLAMTYDFAKQGYEGLEVQANVRNVFDEDGQTCSAGNCYRHQGRTATFAVQRRF
ncbi:TonB-dependent siderophore receptor [Roseovarius sp. SK2]|jgi:iron complex outermembrane receptor protein|uniref:TonB-dependent siderophore receptor n=1 Tax=Roseovarius TaxID=74030 RepID=UPI00237C1C31|nr:TonB-dependent siderophore receptor [Roseovarius sp. SK2]MDD9726824.1 TonB-dependent siderophore receptor [Roseovarius sp. SK2]